MALRRPLWSRPCSFCSPVSAPRPATRHDQLAAYQLRPRVPGQRAHTRSAASAARSKHPDDAPAPLSRTKSKDDGTRFSSLLKAIQKQNVVEIYEAFTQWTDLLADWQNPFHQAALQHAQGLRGTVLSELLRSLDPIDSSSPDPAHGMHIAQGESTLHQSTDIFDAYGVRTARRRILSGLQTLLNVLMRSPQREQGRQVPFLTAADFEVLIRCAGAASDMHAAKVFWGMMPVLGMQSSRTTKTWTDFVKARFLTEPLYYQFDRARVISEARSLYSNRRPLPMTTLNRMEVIRKSINSMQQSPWNRRPDEPDEDLRRILRRKGDFTTYKNHWVRALLYGGAMDEELLCASLVAFARSNSLHSVRTLVFEKIYRVTIEDINDPHLTKVSGGADLRADSSIRPTARLLFAIVEALGSMSHIALATKLVQFFSQRYSIVIPKEVWTNLLNWAYICASKPYQPMRRMGGRWESTKVNAAVVREIWATMTSDPYHVEPSFEDLNIYIKTLIAQKSFKYALDLVRSAAMSHYEIVCAAYEEAVLDELLVNSAEPDKVAAVSERRIKSQTLKSHVHHTISLWFANLLKALSSSKASRTGSATQIMLPDLIAEFGDFFDVSIRYRSAQGIVQLDRSSDPELAARFVWTKRFRDTLPFKLAGTHAKAFEGSGQPDFQWPMAPTLRVLETKRVPRQRLGALGQPPIPDHPSGREWWDRIERAVV